MIYDGDNLSRKMLRSLRYVISVRGVVPDWWYDHRGNESRLLTSLKVHDFKNQRLIRLMADPGFSLEGVAARTPGRSLRRIQKRRNPTAGAIGDNKRVRQTPSPYQVQVG